MINKRWTPLILGIVILVVCLSIQTKVSASGTLYMEAAQPSADGQTILLVKYDGEPALGAADLFVELHGDITTLVEQGELGSDPESASWMKNGNSIYISMISHSGFTGTLAEIPLIIGPQGGRVELIAESVYDQLPMDITGGIALNTPLITFSGEAPPERTTTQITSSLESTIVASESTRSDESTVNETVTTQERQSTKQTTTFESQTIGTGSTAHTNDENHLTETSESSRGTDISDMSNVASTISTQSAESVVESEANLSDIGTELSELDIEPEVTEHTGTVPSSRQISDDTSFEEADIGTGEFPGTFNRILRLVIVILLIAVITAMIVYFVLIRRRR